MEEMKAWISETQIGPDGYFAVTGFESSMSLYHTALSGSFVLSVIDGRARPAPFRVPDGHSAYNELIRVVRRVSLDEQACWFYVTAPDNAFSTLEWVQKCNYNHALDYRLESFERSPAAEGGLSLLGLVGASRRWLLLHEYEQSESFDISVYGSTEFCHAIAAGVGLVG